MHPPGAPGHFGDIGPENADASVGNRSKEDKPPEVMTKKRLKGVEFPKTPSFPDPTSVECRRTLLACYWAASHVSVSLRRPNMLKFSNFMQESMEILEKGHGTAPSDIVLVQWVRLQIIAEEVAVSFEFDDPDSTVTLDDPKIKLAVRGFGRRLDEWNEKAPSQSKNSMCLACDS